MNSDFIPVRELEGTLLLSIKKPDFGMTITTSELIYHKPHANYHLKLEDMVSIVPFANPKKPAAPLRAYQDQTAEYAVSFTEGPSYRIQVASAAMHNRSGRFPLGAMQFVLPLPHRMLQLIGTYSGMKLI
ncbi:hypothetical protein ACLBWT_16595 [Paenibacillus sp. D51F]